MKAVNCPNFTVVTLVLAVFVGGCSDRSSSFTIEDEGFFTRTGNEKVVLETYTLKPSERRQISILSSQQIWVGVSVMNLELLKEQGTDCARIQNTEDTRSVKSCWEAATTFEPAEGKIQLILANLLNTFLEVSVYVEPVEKEVANPPPHSALVPSPQASSARIPKVGETREWELISCVVVASGMQPASYQFDGTQALLMHADEESWGTMFRKASAPFVIEVDPSVPSAKTPFEEMLRPHHLPGPFVLYECIQKKGGRQS